jgi:hypothetical protein
MLPQNMQKAGFAIHSLYGVTGFRPRYSDPCVIQIYVPSNVQYRHLLERVNTYNYVFFLYVVL